MMFVFPAPGGAARRETASAEALLSAAQRTCSLCWYAALRAGSAPGTVLGMVEVSASYCCTLARLSCMQAAPHAPSGGR